MIKKILFWINCSRWPSFAQSFWSALLALVVVLCDRDQTLDWRDVLLGALAVLGVPLAHAGANLFDDYFDYVSHAVRRRKEMVDGGVRARSQKCAYLDSGKATTRQLFVAAGVFCLLATICGLVVLVFRGPVLLIPIASGGLLAFFYSAPPFRLSYRGLGEVVVGLIFGPIVMSGVSLATCGRLTPSVAWLSVPMGILAANILFVHSIMDLDPDLRAGKRALAALLGSPSRAVAFDGDLLITCYFAVIIGVVFGSVSPFALIVLATTPMAIELFLSMRIYLKDPEKVPEPKWFRGPMGSWELIARAGLGWFVFRWYLARNLLTFFALCLLVSTLLARFV